MSTRESARVPGVAEAALDGEAERSHPAEETAAAACARGTACACGVVGMLRSEVEGRGAATGAEWDNAKLGDCAPAPLIGAIVSATTPATEGAAIGWFAGTDGAAGADSV